MERFLVVFFCFGLIYFGKTSAQKKISGEVIYGFKSNIISKEKREKSKELYEVLDKLNEMSKGIDFKLSFNQNESLFDVNNSMDADFKPGSSSYVSSAVTKGKYYYNKVKDELLIESKMYDKYTLIRSTASNTKWKIHTETKKIESFLCTKATTTKVIKNRKGEKSFEIIAWFTTEIPLNYGPVEFNGLPGLILEVKSHSNTFYVKHIKLSDSFNNIKPLNSKNIISVEQHKKNIDKLIERY